MKHSPIHARSLLVAVPLLFSTFSPLTAATPAPVRLHQLGEPVPDLAQGVSWGVPWPQGAVPRETSFNLTDAQGRALPVQTWPLATWPDGSLKWSGLATVVPAGLEGELTLAAGPSAAAGVLKVTSGEKSILIDTGALTCVIPRDGHNLIDSLCIAGTEVARAGQLVCILQSGPVTNNEDAPPRERYLGVIRQVTVEQSGPVRAVVRLEGVHQGLVSGRAWLPFTVRLYFYSGETAVRLVHTIIYDGDQEKDFVRGLGVQFSVPLRDEPRNRTVRFAGAGGGVWSEPLQPGGGNAAQEAGRPFTGRGDFAQNAVWDDFKLSQPNPDGFTIVKRTNPKSTWLASAGGTRAAGLAFVGDLAGGLAVSVKNFWQSYPAGLEVRRASSPVAELIAWLWSPDGPQMDMRHYDLVAHGLLASYEDVQPGMSTAYGIARTSELTLWPNGAGLPARAATGRPRTGRHESCRCSPPRRSTFTPPACSACGACRTARRRSRRPSRTASTPCSRITPKQVDARDWYGFWQFGDFMHSYSAPRHVWHYDWGGHAWDNTELGAPLWLWYSLPAHGPRRPLPARRGPHAQHQRDQRLLPRPDGRARLAPQRGQVGLRRQGGPHQPGRALAAVLLPHHRRAHRRHHARDRARRRRRRAVRSHAPGRAAGPRRAAIRRAPPHRARLVRPRRQLDDGVGAHRRQPLARPHPRRRGLDRGHALLAADRPAERPQSRPARRQASARSRAAACSSSATTSPPAS
jgi:hypothetical protein